MSRIKTEELHDHLIKKRELYLIKVKVHFENSCTETRISGSIKNNFLDDCIRREWNESKMLKNILDVYYSIPGIDGKEMDEIKKYINDKIKL